ncbi:hypothetical protein TNCV_1830191 [Trichonephila clavipes]|nr:hypothetical protein TNCV_1830191 [Trichonephila clavipes]
MNNIRETPVAQESAMVESADKTREDAMFCNCNLSSHAVRHGSSSCSFRISLPKEHSIGATLNNRPSSHKCFHEVGGRGRESWEAPEHPQGVLPQNCGGTKQIALLLISCSKPRLTTSVHLALCSDEFLVSR